MKHSVPLSALAAAVLGSGCIAIPMGTETFTTEYPTDVRTTSDPPAKTYAPVPVVTDGDEYRHSVAIGLLGNITSTRPKVQHYAKVTVEKRKRLAFGITPVDAERMFRPKNALVPQTAEYYKGNGQYKDTPNQFDTKFLGSCVGFWLLLDTPVALFYEPFAPYEKDVHYLGRFVKSESTRKGNVLFLNNVFSAEDIDLLRKFSPEDREKIGAWTYYENDRHPHDTFWNGFSNSALLGFYKFCYYLVHEPEDLSRTTPVDPEVTDSRRTVSGPYLVTLRLPDLGYVETVAVEPGKTEARFRLVDAADGSSFANGSVLYDFPSEGRAAVRDEDDRAILELAMEREWPVTVALPAPRLVKVAGAGGTKTGGGGAASPAGAPYQISSIGRTDDDKGLVVRVTVNDTSKTFDVDRAVQPEVRRMFREQFATGENARRREALAWKTEDGGKTLVYTVTFE